MKGIVLTTNNTMTVRDFNEPLWQTLGEAVGGYIEIVRTVTLPEQYVMVVNEEGILLGLGLNKVASLMYGISLHGNPIRGDVVFMKEGWTDEGPDIVGLDDADLKVIRSLLIRSGVEEEKKQ